MKYFILAQDFELWDIIEEGYIEAPKKKKKLRSENDTKTKLNSRAMHILLCGLSEEVSKKVSTCKRAKEMWEKLERLYGKEEKKDGVPSCANLLQSSKVDGVLALNEPEVCWSKWQAKQTCGNALVTQVKKLGIQYRYSISRTDTSKGFRLLEIPETKSRTDTRSYRYTQRPYRYEMLIVLIRHNCRTDTPGAELSTASF
ncbi:hypothetical protein V6N12_012780 [Hibiscus sabdariffa]|uniref:Uncharacterized protein n=1 Tax=Hibiscus sabdariffa TaxID=183260 RepID=A0ABR2EFD9_9ROSI